MSDLTVDDHVRTLKHLAFCEGDQSGGPEAVSWALDRIEALEAEVARLTEAARLAEMQSDQAVSVAHEGIAEVERLTAERDGLAKALERVVGIYDSKRDLASSWLARAYDMRGEARAALAAAATQVGKP